MEDIDSAQWSEPTFFAFSNQLIQWILQTSVTAKNIQISRFYNLKLILNYENCWVGCVVYNFDFFSGLLCGAL